MGIADRLVALYFAGLSASVLSVPACSGAAGGNFSDGGSRDAAAQVQEEASPPEVDATRPPDDATASGEDAGERPDSKAADDSGGVVDSGGSVDAGDDGSSAGAAECAKICNMGCCDAQGQCHPGNTMAICGAKGNLCENCSKHACTTLTEAPCCGAAGCGCAVAGILGCN